MTDSETAFAADERTHGGVKRQNGLRNNIFADVRRFTIKVNPDSRVYN